MTAEELADALEIMNRNLPPPEAKQAATMLREQAAKLRKYELRNIAQRDRIAILEAQVYGGTTK